MPHSDKGKSRDSWQEIKSVKGSTTVIQAVVSGDITGDVHIDDKIYPRSDLEELSDYLTKAVFAYESRMHHPSQCSSLPDHPNKFLYPFIVEDGNIFFGRDACIEELYQKVVNKRLPILHAKSGADKTFLLDAGLTPRLIKVQTCKSHWN